MNTNNIITFSNEQIGEIRGIFNENGEPFFFVGKVCDCLKLSNSSDSLRLIREKYARHNIKVDGVDIVEVVITDSKGRRNRAKVISEKILYELIFMSRTKKAFEFQQWVLGEVLPELRKYGTYRMEGKLIRRSLTDTIKDSGENERMHGYGFSNYSILINKSLGLPNKNNRNDFTSDELVQIAKREDLVRCMVAEGKNYNEIKTFLESLPTMRKKIVVKVKPSTKKQLYI